MKKKLFFFDLSSNVKDFGTFNNFYSQKKSPNKICFTLLKFFRSSEKVKLLVTASIYALMMLLQSLPVLSNFTDFPSTSVGSLLIVRSGSRLFDDYNS